MPTRKPSNAATAERTSRIYRRRGSDRYYVDVRDLGGGREALIPAGETYATTILDVAESLAARRVDELRAAKESGQRLRHYVGVRQNVTVGHVARAWLEYKRSHCLGSQDGRRTQGHTSPRTLLRYEKALARLFEVLDQDRNASALTVGQAKKALASLRALPSRTGTGVGRAAAHARQDLDAGRVAQPTTNVARPTLSDSSARQAMVAMKLAYDHATDEQWVPVGYNPWEAIRPADRPKQPRTSSTDFLEVYEGHALLEACDRVPCRGVPLRAIVATLLLTGGRLDEVLGLEVDDVDLVRHTVRFRDNPWRPLKDHEERGFKLWPQLEAEIRGYRERASGLRRLLFPSPKEDSKRAVHGEAMLTGLSRRIAVAHAQAVVDVGRRYGRDAAERFRRKSVTARALRPTYCAARLQTTDRGAPVALWTVQAELGHASDKMLHRVYGRLGQYPHRGECVEFVPADPTEVRADAS